MKRTLTAVIALAAAAGFAGMAQAQSTTANTTASPAAQAPASAPATAAQAQANPASAPGAAPANPAMAPPATAPQASTQRPAGSNDFWSRNISQDEVRQAQQQLKAQGLYNGPVDGMVGSEMHRALAPATERAAADRDLG